MMDLLGFLDDWHGSPAIGRFHEAPDEPRSDQWVCSDLNRGLRLPKPQGYQATPQTRGWVSQQSKILESSQRLGGWSAATADDAADEPMASPQAPRIPGYPTDPNRRKENKRHVFLKAPKGSERGPGGTHEDEWKPRASKKPRIPGYPTDPWMGFTSIEGT